MRSIKKITISQNVMTHTTGCAPLSEPYEYYLDINGVLVDSALKFIHLNRKDFPFLEEILFELSTDQIEEDQVVDLAVALAKHTISELHLDLPAKLVFCLQTLESHEEFTGNAFECFGMTLIQVKLSA
jgi:hypothetical protein